MHGPSVRTIDAPCKKTQGHRSPPRCIPKCVHPQMADSFWAQVEEYQKSKDLYKDLLFQKTTFLASHASKTSPRDSKSTDTPTEKVNHTVGEDITAAMATHGLEEVDAAKTEQEANIDKRDPLKFLRSNPAGLKPDELPPFDLKKVTAAVKKMREDSEKGKSKVKKGEWEKIDKILGLGK